MGARTCDWSWPSHCPVALHVGRTASAHVKTAVLLMLSLAAGCSWDARRAESPSRSTANPVIFDANRDRVIRQCQTRADTSAMVIPGKRNSDGSYAAHYETCRERY